MNAFQLLKSGASFSRKRVEKLDSLFKKPSSSPDGASTKASATIDENDQQSKDDRALKELSEKIEANKLAMIEA